MTPEGEQFVSEEIQPAAGSFAAAAMARGQPGLPEQFSWRGTEYRVVELLRQWKTTGPCHSGSDELYVRRHWFHVRVEPAAEMTLYCDRQARNTRRPKARWWLYTIGKSREAGYETRNHNRETP
ncbi:MAG: cytoplasmic protein [Planctomycetes bacterium]|nr:cytoplasmic protein [Planctomycetota bacterium]